MKGGWGFYGESTRHWTDDPDGESRSLCGKVSQPDAPVNLDRGNHIGDRCPDCVRLLPRGAADAPGPPYISRQNLPY